MLGQGTPEKQGNGRDKTRECEKKRRTKKSRGGRQGRGKDKAEEEDNKVEHCKTDVSPIGCKVAEHIRQGQETNEKKKKKKKKKTAKKNRAGAFGDLRLSLEKWLFRFLLTRHSPLQPLGYSHAKCCPKRCHLEGTGVHKG